MDWAVQFGPHGDSLEHSFASLDARANLLLTNRHVQQLIEMNTGTRTGLTTLLYPGTLDRPGFSGKIVRSDMSADGTNFAVIESDDFADGSASRLYLITPVPEPLTLAIFAVLVTGLGVARGRSKRCVAPSSIAAESPCQASRRIEPPVSGHLGRQRFVQPRVDPLRRNPSQAANRDGLTP